MGGFHQIHVFTTVWLNKIGLLIPEQLLPDYLVKLVKGDIIIVQCDYIKKDFLLLFKEE